MNYKLFLMLFIFFGALSCKSKKRPKTLPMDRQAMINILADAEVAQEVAKYYNKKADSVLQIYMDTIYKIHSVDSNKYNVMMKFLEDNTDVYYELEQEIHAKIKDLQDEFSPQDTVLKK